MTKVKIEFCAFLIILAYILFPFWLFVNQISYIKITDRVDLFDYQYWLGCFAAVFLIVKGLKLIVKKLKISFKNIPIILFMGFILLAVVSTMIQSKNTHYTVNQLLFGTEARKEGIFAYIIYIKLFVIAREIQKPIYKKILLYTFITIGVYIAVCARISYVTGKTLNGVTALSGVFLNPNHYGYYLAMLFSCTFTILIFKAYELNKTRNISNIFILTGLLFSIIILTFVIFQNASMGTVIACAAAIVFMILLIAYQHKAFWFAVLIIMILSIIFLIILLTVFSQNQMYLELKTDIFKIITNSPEAKSAGSGRWELWVLTVDQIKEKPLLGWGIEGIAPYLKTHAINGTQRTHNEYLQYTAFFGIPAGLFYLGGIVTAFAEGFKRKITGIESAFIAGAFAYAVNAAVGVSMFYTAPQFFILLGLANRKVLTDEDINS